MLGTRGRCRRRAVPVGLSALVALVVCAGPLSARAEGRAPKPTVVLVHGAFADASGWAGVIERLQRDGYPVIAPADPLRSVAGDARYIADVLATITGPVILVGHSYGGAVITNAARGNRNVKALVYIAAYAPDQGETVLGLTGPPPASRLPLALRLRPFPGGGLDGYIDAEQFRDVFAGDLSAATAAVMAASQRPVTLAAGLEPSGEPAWRTIPSWYLVARDDRTIPPRVERFMAKRAGSHVVEIGGSHVAMISHPNEVADLIRTAAAATTR